MSNDKTKTITCTFWLVMIFILTTAGVRGELIEKIFAVVNGEAITLSELQNAEQQQSNLLRADFSGDQLKAKIDEMRARLLQDLIDQKVLLSMARLKDLDISGQLESVLRNIKQENNLKTDEELKDAITRSGSDYDQWLEQVKDNVRIQAMLWDKYQQDIKVENSEMVEFYRAHEERFTTKRVYTLHCIYLDKSQFPDPAAEKLRVEIKQKLTPDSFNDLASQYSQLPSQEDKHVLGTFRKGELDPNIEQWAETAQKGEFSDWVETESGWYLLKLADLVPAMLREYKDVREEIYSQIFNSKLEVLRLAYLEELKKDSYIKILEKYPPEEKS